jgi:L-fuculose-phosphate aldolase
MTRRARDRQVIAAARALTERGLVVGTAGNVSVRDGDRIRMTPTRTAYAGLRRSGLVTLDLDCEEPPPTASLEWRLHVEIYRRRPEVRAVVHAHGPWSTAWSCHGEPLAPELEEATYYGIGTVCTAPHAPAGSAELAERTARTLGASGAVLLERHGLVAVGDTPDHALNIAQAVEHQAHVAWLVRGAGGPSAGGVVSQPRAKGPPATLLLPIS